MYNFLHIHTYVIFQLNQGHCIPENKNSAKDKSKDKITKNKPKDKITKNKPKFAMVSSTLTLVHRIVVNLLEKKNYFRVKPVNMKFLHVNNMWDFSLFTEQDMIDKKNIVFFWIYGFSSKLSYHSYQERIYKFLFLIRIFVKTNSNLTCGCF